MSIVNFPRMHPGLASASCPEWVSFFCPGIFLDEKIYPVFQPLCLPMSEQESLRYARKVNEFAAQFRDPKELAAIKSGSGQIPFYQDTVQALGDEMKAYMQPKSEAKTDEQRFMLQGQMNLIMAWIIEEQALDLCGLGDAFEAFQLAMDQTLGVEEGSRTPPAADQGTANQEHMLVHWTKLLPWFLFFMGSDDALFVQESEVMADWQERGLEFEPARPEDLDPFVSESIHRDTVLYTCISTGHDLLGSRLRGSQPSWLEKEFRIFALRAQAHKA